MGKQGCPQYLFTGHDSELKGKLPSVSSKGCTGDRDGGLAKEANSTHRDIKQDLQAQLRLT